MTDEQQITEAHSKLMSKIHSPVLNTTSIKLTLRENETGKFLRAVLSNAENQQAMAIDSDYFDGKNECDATMNFFLSLHTNIMWAIRNPDYRTPAMTEEDLQAVLSKTSYP